MNFFKIICIFERAVRTVYKDKLSSFENLLEKEAIRVHVRNLKVLESEIFKVKNSIATKTTQQVTYLNFLILLVTLKIKDFISNYVKTVYFSTESVSYLGPNIWDPLPPDVRTLTPLTLFKSQGKKWIPQNCPG